MTYIASIPDQETRCKLRIQPHYFTPMSKTKIVNLSILKSAYDRTPNDPIATKHYVSALQAALDESERDRKTLERDIRALELTLSKK